MRESSLLAGQGIASGRRDIFSTLVTGLPVLGSNNILDPGGKATRPSLSISPIRQYLCFFNLQ